MIEVVIWLQSLQLIRVGAFFSPLELRIVTQVDLGSWNSCSAQDEIQYQGEQSLFLSRAKSALKSGGK